MLEDLLINKKTSILRRWFELAVGVYPSDTQKFLKTHKNPFTNPVGACITGGTEKIFDLLLQGVDCRSEECCLCLDKVLRIRAVQDISAAQAVGFVFLLKRAIRETLDKEIRQNQLAEQLLAFEARIDSMALLAFDVFMQCREQLYEIKANEIRNRTGRMLERVCRKYGISYE
jgi:hypothetical protein